MSAPQRTHEPALAGAGDTAWERLAQAAAARAQGAGESQPRHEFLTLRLGGTPYAIPVERVREIVRMRAVTPMPRVPSSLIGVISLRGEIVEVLDLRRRLGLPPKAPTRDARIIVLHGEDGRTAGLLVDRVSDVLRVTGEAIREDAPGEPGRVAALCARGSEFVSILDLGRVLDLDDGR